MATYNYKGSEIATVNVQFLEVMYNDYQQLKNSTGMLKNQEVNWCFFHKDHLNRILNSVNDVVGIGLTYIANSPKIIYPSDMLTNTQHASINTIIALVGVANNGKPLFLKSQVNTEQDIALASLEPCPKVCNPPIPAPTIFANTPTNAISPQGGGTSSCFQLYYQHSGLINPQGNRSTDACFELDKADFYTLYGKYLTTKVVYQKFESAYFSKDAISQLLSFPDCIGIRCGVMLYYNSYRCMFVVGINNDPDRTWQWNNIILFSNLDLDIP